MEQIWGDFCRDSESAIKSLSRTLKTTAITRVSHRETQLRAPLKILGPSQRYCIEIML